MQPQRYGLIGERLGHSFSKQIHEQLADYTYDLIELPPDQLAPFFTARAFSAVNVTIPYKEAVIPLLDEVDPKALSIGAVNTVVNRGGRLTGYNTDYDGLDYLLHRHGILLGGRVVMILGTGGTSKTCAALARDKGAREILFVSRSGKGGALTYHEAALRRDVQVLLNTTPCGMFPNNDGMPLDPALFRCWSPPPTSSTTRCRPPLCCGHRIWGCAAPAGWKCWWRRQRRHASCFSAGHCRRKRWTGSSAGCGPSGPTAC